MTGLQDRIEAVGNPADPLDEAVESALAWLDARQDADGFWSGKLESNCCMEAEWLLALHFLGIRDDPKEKRLVRCILNNQRQDGAWETYYRAPQGDINTTVEAYAALRAAGMPPDAAPLQSARKWIFAHGGLGGIRVFTRFWLALIGEWPWQSTPSVPPEIIAFPLWFPFNIYNFSCWARATLLPISILSVRRAVRPLPAAGRLDELFPQGREKFDYRLPRKGARLSWEGLFRVLDRLLHFYRALGLTPGREAAIKACLEWIIRHQDADGAWGGIQPPWIYSLLALSVEGYPTDHPVLAKSLGALDRHWSYEKDDGLHIQACESVVWDTLLTLLAMHDCGRSPLQSATMERALEWTLEKQVHAPGDWQVKVKHARPGGWPFERANRCYPDIDDTAVALIVLALVRPHYRQRARLDQAVRLAMDWILAMQCRGGGWAAFDRDNDNALLTRLPFCDFGEVLDPPSADVTGHVVEALGLLGMTLKDAPIRRAVEYLMAEQEAEGSWFGRWGVNHIYGTAAVLPALKAAGQDMHAAWVAKAGDWILSRQNVDGGWGESCASYMDDALRGRGESTASQTGWALMALMAVGAERYRPAVRRAVAYLIARQKMGTWEEPCYTGTGFPGYGIGAKIDLDAAARRRLQQHTELSRAFMINYNLYRHYFPLMALGRARRFLARP